MKLFRLGGNLLLGEQKNCETVNGASLHHLEVAYVLRENSWAPVKPLTVKVLGSFVVNENFTPYDEHIQESETEIDYSDIVHENFVPFMGRKWVKFGNRQVVAYQRRGEGIGWLTEGDQAVNWTALPNVLENGQVGQFMILEALRPQLVGFHLVSPAHRGPVQEGFTDLTETIHVYMKTEPFRDITKLKEGTAVSALGYYKGCVVIEADSELFWKPLEENAYWDQKQKDDAYYFNMDGNKDGLPDPLQALPSKPGLYTSPPRGSDNHNVQPELRKAVQHFGPNQNLLGEEDFGILGESYIGTHGYEDDERLQDPETHDVAVEPGLDGSHQDYHVSTAQAKKDRDTFANDDGRDGVPQDYTGEYGDEDVPTSTVKEAMNLIMSGIDVDSVLEGLSNESREKIKLDLLKKTFPLL